MKLSSETLARHAEKTRERQLELPHFPPPMTANRARDFGKECKICQVECDYCHVPERR